MPALQPMIKLLREFKFIAGTEQEQEEIRQTAEKVLDIVQGKDARKKALQELSLKGQTTAYETVVGVLAAIRAYEAVALLIQAGVVPLDHAAYGYARCGEYLMVDILLDPELVFQKFQCRVGAANRGYAIAGYMQSGRVDLALKLIKNTSDLDVAFEEATRRGKQEVIDLVNKLNMLKPHFTPLMTDEQLMRFLKRASTFINLSDAAAVLSSEGCRHHGVRELLPVVESEGNCEENMGATSSSPTDEPLTSTQSSIQFLFEEDEDGDALSAHDNDSIFSDVPPNSPVSSAFVPLAAEAGRQQPNAPAFPVHPAQEKTLSRWIKALGLSVLFSLIGAVVTGGLFALITGSAMSALGVSFSAVGLVAGAIFFPGGLVAVGILLIGLIVTAVIAYRDAHPTVYVELDDSFPAASFTNLAMHRSRPAQTPPQSPHSGSERVLDPQPGPGTTASVPVSQVSYYSSHWF